VEKNVNPAGADHPRLPRLIPPVVDHLLFTALFSILLFSALFFSMIAAKELLQRRPRQKAGV
jgi:hypothetical protein